AQGRARRALAEVEIAHSELVLGQKVGQLADALASRAGVARVGKLPDEGPVLVERLARRRLVPVRLLVLAVVAERELVAGVVAPRGARVAVQVVAVAEARLGEAGRAPFLEVGVGDHEQGLAPERIVRIRLEHEGQVLASLLVLLFLDEALALGEEHLLGRAQELLGHLVRALRRWGRAAGHRSGQGKDENVSLQTRTPPAAAARTRAMAPPGSVSP